MTRDPLHSVAGLTAADITDEPVEMTAEEQLAEYRRRVGMHDALTAVEVRHLHSLVTKVGHDQFKHHERSRALLTEIRDVMKDILVEARGNREFLKDIRDGIQELVAMKQNGHAH